MSSNFVPLIKEKHSHGPQTSISPIALRTAETPQSFGHSECKRVRQLQHVESTCVTTDDDDWLVLSMDDARPRSTVGRAPDS